MGDGQQSNNPWLQEFPDPITRASWDNYLTISASDAKDLGIKNVNVANGALNGSYANVEVKNTVLKVPVIIQPGQAKGSIGLALGYGKIKGIKEEMQVGVNAFKFYNNFNQVQDANVSLADGFHEFACVQLHNTLMGRGDIVKETTLEIFNTKNKKDWNPVPVVSKNHIEEYEYENKNKLNLKNNIYFTIHLRGPRGSTIRGVPQHGSEAGRTSRTHAVLRLHRVRVLDEPC